MEPESASSASASGWRGLGAALTPAEWRRGAVVVAAILGLHVLGFGLLLLTASRDFALGTGATFGIALGITAYTLGMRHAFDADHIAAIDNTTRKLINEGQRPLSVGFFFALGHSTIVLVLALLLAIGIRGLSGAVESDSSTLKDFTSVIGPSVAGLFLLVIGILNLIVLVGIIKVFVRMRHGEYNEAQLEEQLDSRGFMNRFYGRATRAVKKPWQMYPVGLLFGLGFDTATEVALLATAGTAAAGELPLYAILSLPILFAAGMTLLDTLDGAFMNFAYSWSFFRPVRKVFYNITITSLSVIVALVIGPISLIGGISEKLTITDGVIGFVAGLELENVGYAIVALFALTWGIALGVWRFGRIEEKWTAKLQRSEAG